MKSGLLLLIWSAGGLAAEGIANTEARAAQQRSAARQVAAAAEGTALAVQRQSVARQVAAALRFAPPPGTAAAEPAFPTCEPLPPAQVEPLLAAAARREDLSLDLLRAVARRESGFRPCAVSRAGAAGLMQLMPASIRQLGVSNAFDPKESIDSGARLLKDLLIRYGGNVALSLGAYNAGPGRVDAAAGVPPIPETIDYVRAILGEQGPGKTDPDDPSSVPQFP